MTAMLRGSMLLLGALLALKNVAAIVIPQDLQVPIPISSLEKPPLPLVVWHGLGDNYKADGLRTVASLVNKTIPGTFTYFVRLDADPSADRTATFIGNLTLQVAQVCADIAAHPILSHSPAINALGFSQGGQFMRAYIERCNNPPVANFVTFGSQHNGISEFQECATTDWLCQGWQGILRGNTWSSVVQNKLVPAQYFRNPEDLDSYIESSNFLADINNEREVKNATYKENLKKLESFTMYMFSEDETVIPKQSAWFSDFNATTGKETKLEDRALYKEDWLGLKWLDENGRLEFPVTEGGHMQLSEEVLVKAFKKYFKPQAKSAVHELTLYNNSREVEQVEL